MLVTREQEYRLQKCTHNDRLKFCEEDVLGFVKTKSEKLQHSERVTGKKQVRN